MERFMSLKDIFEKIRKEIPIEINAYLITLKPQKTNMELALEGREELNKMLRERGLKEI